MLLWRAGRLHNISSVAYLVGGGEIIINNNNKRTAARRPHSQVRVVKNRAHAHTHRNHVARTGRVGSGGRCLARARARAREKRSKAGFVYIFCFLIDTSISNSCCTHAMSRRTGEPDSVRPRPTARLPMIQSLRLSRSPTTHWPFSDRPGCSRSSAGPPP